VTSMKWCFCDHCDSLISRVGVDDYTRDLSKYQFLGAMIFLLAAFLNVSNTQIFYLNYAMSKVGFNIVLNCCSLYRIKRTVFLNL